MISHEEMLKNKNIKFYKLGVLNTFSLSNISKVISQKYYKSIIAGFFPSLFSILDDWEVIMSFTDLHSRHIYSVDFSQFIITVSIPIAIF